MIALSCPNFTQPNKAFMPTTTATKTFTTKEDFHQSSNTDRFQHHDYMNVDDLLEDDHLMARQAVRDWIKAEVSPIIDDAAMRGVCPHPPLQRFGGDWSLRAQPTRRNTGGGGMDEIAYGVIMQELERCDSGLRSMASVQGSLVMYPIYKYGNEATKKKYLPKLGAGRVYRLLRPDGTQLRLRPQFDDHQHKGRRRPLRAERCQDVDKPTARSPMWPSCGRRMKTAKSAAW